MSEHTKTTVQIVNSFVVGKYAPNVDIPNEQWISLEWLKTQIDQVRGWTGMRGYDELLRRIEQKEEK